MKNFLYWRKMTWAILLASTGMVFWVLGTGFGVVAIGVSVLLLGVVGGIWFLTQPLWRQGRGIHLRRLQASTSVFKSVERLIARVDPASARETLRRPDSGCRSPRRGSCSEPGTGARVQEAFSRRAGPGRTPLYSGRAHVLREGNMASPVGSQVDCAWPFGGHVAT
jgi:hypothetical protein